MSTTQQEELASAAASVAWRRVDALESKLAEAERRAEQAEAKLGRVASLVESDGCKCSAYVYYCRPLEDRCLACRISETLK